MTDIVQGFGARVQVFDAVRTGISDIRVRRAVLLLLDAAIIWADLATAESAGLLLPWSEPAAPRGFPLPTHVVIMVAWLLLLSGWGAYRHGRVATGAAEYSAVAAASWTLLGLLGVGGFLFNLPLSRGSYAALLVLGPASLLAERFVTRRALIGVRRMGLASTDVLVAGSLDHIRDVVAMLRREDWLGYRVVGLLLSGHRNEHDDPAHLNLPVLGRPTDALQAVEMTGARAVIYAEGSFGAGPAFNKVARQFERHPAHMIVVPALTDVAARRVRVRPIGGIPLVFVEPTRGHLAARASKRLFDLVGSSLLILAAAPVILATALAIKLEDGGPVFFRQTRVGRDCRLFEVLKFRSMCTEAEDLKRDLVAHNEGQGVLFKIARDPRVTRVGRFIRRFSIDEIPQFINVWRGDMSLVGPRPALPVEVERYEEQVLRRLDVRPGITGLWQVSGRSDLSWEDTVRLDVSYVDNWSMMQDLSIVLRTIPAVLRGAGAY